MVAKKIDKKSPTKKPQRVETRFVRDAVSLHADGVWGGLTPQRQIVMGFFTEQFAIPEKVTYELPEVVPGNLREVARQGGGYVLRDIQAQVYISVTTAKSLIGWLQDRITQAESITEQLGGTDSDSDVGIIVAVEASE